MTQPVIVWFRRDLRLADNRAMAAAVKSGQPILPLFIFDPAILKSERLGLPRLKFMLHALTAMNDSLNVYDSALVIRHGKPLAVLQQDIEETGAAALHFNHDFTPYARHRDDAVKNHLGVPVNSYHDRLLVPLGDIMKADGTPYTVYTPFKKQWRGLDKAYAIEDYVLSPDGFYDLKGVENAGIPTLDDLGFPDTIDVPKASAQAALQRLSTFIDSGDIYRYRGDRNRVGNALNDPQTGTSFLSPYLRFGLISPRQIYHAAREAYQRASHEDAQKSVTTFVDELIWHEFYTHILYHFPHVATENFNAKYDAVQWREDSDDFAQWQAGQTGYPLIDAAMRQLKATGWMHNRARMVVASFLTKDLLIDWRPGELHFMQWLIDGDLAANNGGWQWTAGTGTDAQPYFRIFNPVSQSRKFDPDGTFIRCWVPELRNVPDEHIHEPWKMDEPPEDYPPPMVDHHMARERTLDAFSVTKQSGDD